jgi:drug/metabolite transporter (DMT)-like permease
VPVAVIGSLFTVYIAWGSTYLATAFAVQTMPPVIQTGVRFMVSGVLIGAVLMMRGGVKALKVTWRQLLAAALVGTGLIGGGTALLSVSLQYIPSGVGALIVAVTPLWLVLFRLVVGERPRWQTWAGVFLGFIGVALLVRPQGGASPFLLPPILGAFTWALASFIAPGIGLPVSLFVAAVWEMLIGGAITTLIGSFVGESRSELLAGSLASWTAFSYLAVIGAVAFTAYTWLLGNAPISLVGTYAFVNPVVAVFLGALILAEPITSALIFEGSLVIAGVALVVLGERNTPQRN